MAGVTDGEEGEGGIEGSAGRLFFCFFLDLIGLHMTSFATLTKPEATSSTLIGF